MLEMETRHGSFDVEITEQRTTGFQLLTILMCQRPECQSLTNIEFVLGMNVVDITDIGGRRHACVRDRQAAALSVSKKCPAISAGGILVWLLPPSELHEIEWQFRIAEPFALIVQHGAFFCDIQLAVDWPTRIVFFLIPKRTP